MKVSYISDLHLDFYIKRNTTKSLENFYKRFIYGDEADILVIAGDLSHYNSLTLSFLKHLSAKNIYKHIFVVLGNHDYYLISNSQRDLFKNNSFNRVDDIRKSINDLNNVTCLNGDLIEFEGKKIFGFDSWYDGSYYYKLTNGYADNIETFWKSTMNDSRYIKGINSFYDLAKIEKEKIRKLYDKYKDIEIDLCISHMAPMSEPIFYEDKYRTDKTSGFYSFDCSYEIDNMKIKNWIYGHSHFRKVFEVYDTTFHVNAFGYPGELKHSSYIEHMYI